MGQATSLRIVDETSVLPAVDAEAFRQAAEASGPPACVPLPEAGEPTPDAFRIGGAALEAWPFEHRPPAPRPLHLCLSNDVSHLPAFGVVMLYDGPR